MICMIEVYVTLQKFNVESDAEGIFICINYVD